MRASPYDPTRVVCCVLLSAALLSCGAADARGAATVFSLGRVGVIDPWLPGSVSADGGVVAAYVPGLGGAAYWTPEEGVVRLRDAEGNLIPDVSATAVSGDGSWIAGLAGRSNGAFRWNRSRAVEYFTLSPSTTSRYITAASGDGSVVVGDEGPEFMAEHRPFRWTRESGVVPLAAPPGGPSRAWVWDVSADAGVMVGAAADSARSAAVRWHANGDPEELRTPAGYTRASARGVSPDGLLIAGTVNSSSDQRPALWRGNELVVLGLPPGAVSGFGMAVSDNGVVVGGATDIHRPVNITQAFVWDAVHGSRWLSDVLAEAGAAVNGWTFLGAVDISADGLTIVGDGGGPSGRYEGYVAVLPEPICPSAVALLLCRLLRRRRT
jgi:uncharacterized membrane protein